MTNILVIKYCKFFEQRSKSFFDICSIGNIISAMKKSVILKKGRETPVKAGHPWIFSQGITNNDVFSPGEAVSVYAFDNTFLGIGLVNPHSDIRVRMIDSEDVTLDTAYYQKRFLQLLKYKKTLLPENTTGYRLVNADADRIPGLIADVYGRCLVVQFHAMSAEAFRKPILSALENVLNPEIIVERSDLEVRKREGLLPIPARILKGTLSGLPEFSENGLCFFADVMEGQKTGFFLDQRTARNTISQYVKGKRVLNLFSYTGAFGVYAAKNNALHTINLDSSDKAQVIARDNYSVNGLLNGHVDFVTADAFNFLYSTPDKFDVIICDPPAFAKSQHATEKALKAYTSVNAQCIGKLDKNGVILTSSCSGRITMEDFKHALKVAAYQAKRSMHVLHELSHAPDHTDALAFPEGRYLKTIVLKAMD
jgi:23S rRNA (cytosine1962-C5)-methyltransferase